MIGIYKITNNVNGKCYIGQSGRLESRLNAHKDFLLSMKSHNNELYQDIEKLGVDNFSFEILEVIDITEIEEKHIQNHILNGYELYNKILYPTDNKGIKNPLSKISETQLSEVIQLLKENEMSNKKIAEKYNCSSSVIDDINNGKRYIVEGEDYPIRKDRFTAKGSLNNSSLISEEEVLKIRQRYVNETISEIYKDYKNIYTSIKAFEGMVQGKTYKHLPIYKKREKIWI